MRLPFFFFVYFDGFPSFCRFRGRIFKTSFPDKTGWFKTEIPRGVLLFICKKERLCALLSFPDVFQ
jgi:hypothetical protein